MKNMRLIIIAIIAVLSTVFFVYPTATKAYVYAPCRYVYTQFILWKTSDWHTVNTSQAVIRYGLADKDDAVIVGEDAETAINKINKELNFEPKGKTLFVIYPDGMSLARSFGWDSDAGAMGVYYGGVIRLLSPKLWVKPVAGQTFLQTFEQEGPILHEYVHLVIDNKTNGNYTRWFTEGLAQYYEDKFLGNVDNHPSIKAPYELSDMGDKFDSLQDQQWAYAQSYLMVKNMMQNYGSKKMDVFIKDLGRGEGFSSAFKKTYGITLEDFFKELKFSAQIKRI
jgi:hypothetical protein